MEDIFTDEGKRLIKSWIEGGKFLVGLGLSFALNERSSFLFLRSIVSPRNDDVFVPYGVLILALMLFEIGIGHALKKLFSPALGKGVAFGGWVAPLTPLIVLWAWALAR